MIGLLIERAPEVAVLSLFRHLADTVCLTRVATCSQRLQAFLDDTDASSASATLWRNVFFYECWRPAPEAALAILELETTFRWSQECVRRRRARLEFQKRDSDVRPSGQPYFLTKPGWVAVSKDTPDRCPCFSYSVHNMRTIQALYGDGDDVSQAGDTVAVIHGRDPAVIIKDLHLSSWTSRCGIFAPDESFHPSVTEESNPSQANLERIWRTRLPGSRRLRYFEVQILNSGRHGFIACGAVQLKAAKRLRTLGAQPGWGGGTFPSIGYHGDDGHLYPGAADCEDDSRGQPFGPCFSLWSKDLQSPAGPPPAGSVLTQRDGPLGDGRAFDQPRVCGTGIDLDNNCFFFTCNGALVGQASAGKLSPSDCVPAVGLHSPGEVVRINTGCAPFWFPIEAYSANASSVPRWQNPASLSEQNAPESSEDSE